MVSTRPPISKSSIPFNSPLVTVPNSPITIGMIVTFIFHSILIPKQDRGTYPYFHFFLVLICGQPGQKSQQVCNFTFLLLIIIRSGALAEIRWSVCMSKSHRNLCVLFSRTAAGLCIYHLFVWSNLNFLHISQWITLSTKSFLVLHSVCANLLHSLIMYLMVSSLSPYSLHLLFCCVLGVWWTASLLKSPGLFSEFWPIDETYYLFNLNIQIKLFGGSSDRCQKCPVVGGQLKACLRMFVIYYNSLYLILGGKQCEHL